MRHRSRTDIAALILEAANGGSAKTKIMYKAFLSYVHLRQYLNILIENGLIEHNVKEQIFKITDKSSRFLRLYNQVDELISTEDWDSRVPHVSSSIVGSMFSFIYMLSVCI